MQRLTLVMAAAGLLLATSCGGDDLPTNRGEPPIDDGGEGVSPIDGGAAGDGGGSAGPCPTDPPKLGERCGLDYTESTMCELKVGECVIPGRGGVVDYTIFCCPAGIWETCGGRYPCDDVPPPDAAPATPDAAVSPDAGVDAGVDATPDMAVAPDVAPDLSPDLEPDVAADTAPDAGADAGDDAAGTDA